MKNKLPLILLCFVVLSVTHLHAAESTWETVTAKGAPTARHEAAFVSFQGKCYLIGGRRINPVDVFDPITNSWSAKSETPIELHHFQAVVVGDAIYLIGAMTGPWPNEKPVEKIVVYYPKTDEFKFVHSIPETRRRGGAGAVFHDGKIYIVGGITNGHMDGYQPWLDVYDPKTGDWKPLADAPHARDHFQAVVHEGMIYALAGRTTSQRTNQGFNLTVEPVDVYDLKQKKWLPTQECPKLPTGRAGNMAMVWGKDVVVAGGESATQKVAHNEVEAYNVTTKKWRQWPSLKRGRHGSGFAIVGDYVYTASGSGNRGGGPELTSIERLKLPSDTEAANASSSVKQWHTKTLVFNGPQSSEEASLNPFTDYRLTVKFEHPEANYVVRGYYAADGNSAETSATDGNVWEAKFSPDRAGQWKYTASFCRGTDIAISDDLDEGAKIEIANASGTFSVHPNAVSGAAIDFRQRGRIVADRGYFRLGESGPYWLKGGTDSPENLLAFDDFDGTYRISTESTKGEATATKELHRFTSHIKDWVDGDPEWMDGKGKGLIGAINYLSSMGINAAYFLTMNIGGDGKDVWPYVAPDDFTRFDCSKLDQWGIIFKHMQRRGILMHVVTQETENERMLDDGDTGRLRKLYYRELIARFAHHPALVWNLGEENGPADFSPDGQTAKQQKAMAEYLKKSDPYGHPVVIHTHATPKGKDEILPSLLGHQSLDGLSFQVKDPKAVHRETIRWRKRAESAGKQWLIGMDEIGPWHTGVVPDSDDPQHTILRRHVLWGSLLAGASGVEWYFGAKFPHNDLTSEDWRQRENIWKQTKHALDFFQNHLRFWEMKPSTSLVSNAAVYCLADPGASYAFYVPGGTLSEDVTLTVNLGSRKEEFAVQWYDPLHGGSLQSGSVARVQATEKTQIGLPPHQHDQDWVVLIK